MKLINYLMYPGNCEAAIDFYQEKLGATVAFMSRFSEMPANEEPDWQMPPEAGDLIMHATLMFGEQELMMCDNPDPNAGAFAGFSISIAAESAEQAKTCFDALAAEGTVQMPLTETFWAESFGMLQDKFGVGWMVNYPGDKMPAQ